MVKVGDKIPRGWVEFSGRIKNYVSLTKEQEYEFGEKRAKLREEIKELEYERSGANGQAPSINLEIGLRRNKITKLEDKFTKQNMNLLLAYGKTYSMRNPQIDKDDLISYLHEVLLRSVRGFNHTKGYKFSSYAMRGMQLATRKLYRNHNKKWEGYHYLEDKVSPNDDNEFSSFIEDREHPNIKDDLNLNDLGLVLGKALEKLEPTKQYVIRQRFGLNNERKSFTLKEMSKLMDVKKERVRQIQIEALEELAKRDELIKLK